jgi:hypothetical protein
MPPRLTSRLKVIERMSQELSNNHGDIWDDSVPEDADQPIPYCFDLVNVLFCEITQELKFIEKRLKSIDAHNDQLDRRLSDLEQRVEALERPTTEGSPHSP